MAERKILITGATGFIGRHLTRRLVDEGCRARALVRNLEAARAILPEGVELVVRDIFGLA